MQTVKSSGSKIEVALGKALFARGDIYRKNDKIVFRKLEIAIFSL